MENKQGQSRKTFLKRSASGNHLPLRDLVIGSDSMLTQKNFVKA